MKAVPYFTGHTHGAAFWLAALFTCVPENLNWKEKLWQGICSFHFQFSFSILEEKCSLTAATLKVWFLILHVAPVLPTSFQNVGIWCNSGIFLHQKNSLLNSCCVPVGLMYLWQPQPPMGYYSVHAAALVRAACGPYGDVRAFGIVLWIPGAWRPSFPMPSHWHAVLQRGCRYYPSCIKNKQTNKQLCPLLPTVSVRTVFYAGLYFLKENTVLLLPSC